MRVRIIAERTAYTGQAPDNTPSMLADFARIMLGCACYKINDDGSQGRSIDPQWVKIDGAWIVGDPTNVGETESRRDAERGWREVVAPCEASASRDPGRAS